MEEAVEHNHTPNDRWIDSRQPEAETTVEYWDHRSYHSNSLMRFVKSGIDRRTSRLPTSKTCLSFQLQWVVKRPGRMLCLSLSRAKGTARQGGRGPAWARPLFGQGCTRPTRTRTHNPKNRAVKFERQPAARKKRGTLHRISSHPDQVRTMPSLGQEIFFRPPAQDQRGGRWLLWSVSDGRAAWCGCVMLTIR